MAKKRQAMTRSAAVQASNRTRAHSTLGVLSMLSVLRLVLRCM